MEAHNNERNLNRKLRFNEVGGVKAVLRQPNPTVR